MTVFLCSSPTEELNEYHSVPALYEKNGLVRLLAQRWPEEARCLMIAADPDNIPLNEEMTGFYAAAVENSGLPVVCFDLWDGRLPGLSKEDFDGYDAVFLAGGHLPTEWAWFEHIGLKDLLEGYEGLVIGTSAGSMNCAEMVFAWPELEGESEDPDYQVFFSGLGLARTNLLPHYQKVKDSWLDGKHLVGEIAAGHSWGRRFLVVPDGSFVLVENGVETVFGTAWLMQNGEMTPFCGEEECRVFWGRE